VNRRIGLVVAGILLGACATPILEQVAAPVAESSTAITVQWTTTEPTRGRVDFGLDDAYGEFLTDDTLRTDHRVQILGMPPRTEVFFAVTATTEGGASETLPGAVVTAAVPAAYPDLDLEVFLPDVVEDGWIVGSLVKTPNSAVILSTGGYLVWWHSGYETEGVTTTAGFLSHDGQSIYYDLFDPDSCVTNGTFEAEIHKVSLTGETEVFPAPCHHHDFTELPDGTLAWIAYDPQTVEGRRVAGDKIVERAPDGTTRDVWSAWDWFTYDPDAEDLGNGWTHANSIFWEEDQGFYLVSLYNLSIVIQVDRDGQVLDQYAGDDGDWVYADPSQQFRFQHSADLVDGGEHLLVFDNGDSAEMDSRAVRYDLDAATHTMVQDWEWNPDPHLFTTALGRAEVLPGGNLLVGWGGAGRYDEVTPEGELVLSLSLGMGTAAGFAGFVPELGGTW